LLGQRLKKKYGIPMVVDFRDEWLIAIEYLENHRRSAFSRWIQTKMMRRILVSADAILATTRASADQLSSYAKCVGSDAKVHCIYNGYDESDLAESSPEAGVQDPTGMNATGGAKQDASRLRIVYTGTLWELTDISPVVESLRRLVLSNPEIASKVKLSIAGRLAPKQQAIVDGLHDSPVEVQCLGYLPHNECIDLARSADLLLLLLADRPGAERVVPAKLFEYLALRRHVLAICGEGETEKLLRQRSQVVRFHPNDHEGIANYIQANASKPRTHTQVSNTTPDDLEAFSRRRLTQQLVGIMRDLSP
jgi:glycosyltransferase involved in cell wall biosynthesis